MPSRSQHSISFPRRHSQCSSKPVGAPFVSIVLGPGRSAAMLKGQTCIPLELLISASPNHRHFRSSLSSIKSRRAASEAAFSLFHGYLPPFSIAVPHWPSFLQQRPLDCFYLYREAVAHGLRTAFHVHSLQRRDSRTAVARWAFDNRGRESHEHGNELCIRGAAR